MKESAPSTVDVNANREDAGHIELRDVYKIFGVQTAQALERLQAGEDKQSVQQATGTIVGLAGINATFPAQQLSCVMGLSGSGKSTLVRHINRLIDPSAGTILINGQDIVKLDAAALRHLRRHQVSMVFQGFGLFPHLSIVDNVAFGLEVRGEDKRSAREQAQHWLERVSLQSYGANYPDELSGGMQQRVGLARALAVDTPILLMDEAFSALDPLIRAEMQDELHALQKQLRKTIVFVTHDIDEAFRLGQHIVILRDGKVEQSGSAQDIRSRPVSEYVARFVQRSTR